MYFQDYMGCAMQKNAFEHEQNCQIQIILCMYKVSSRPLFSIDTFYSIQ